MSQYMHRADVSVGNIHLVLTAKVAQNLYEKRIRYPYLPEPGVMLGELQEMNRLEGIPAIVNTRRNGENQLLLYITAYYLVLYESLHGDGYRIAYVDSLNLYEHERLSKGALRIYAQNWYLHHEAREIPQGNNNFWQGISAAWLSFERQRQHAAPGAAQEELTHAHEHYLDMLEDLIEVTHQLDQDKNSLNAGIHYKKVEAAGEVRDAPRDIYVFRLTDLPQLSEKSMLRVKDAQDLRGRVLGLEGLKLTLKFENLIDRRRIPEQGVLEPMVSPLIYQKQREALEMLRTRESKNAHLLRALVDHTYLPYQPDRIRQDSDDELKKLTPEQFDAFRYALTVPDVLMVLGPPGTGKTRTITEIARHCGLRRQRVLIASGTHKAVDNVLERMPEDLIVIRVGHESNVSEKMRPKMIDAQAQKLQEVLLENTENETYRLGPLLSYKKEIDSQVHKLTGGQTYLTDHEARLHALYQERSTSQERITGPFRQRFDELGTGAQHLTEKVAQDQERIRVWSARSLNAEPRSHLPALGWAFKMFFDYATSRVEQAQVSVQEKLSEIQALRQEQARQYETAQRTLLADSAYQQCESAIRQLTMTCERVWAELLKIIKALQATTIRAMPRQPDLEPKGTATLKRYLSWFKETREGLERRARLLKDWREELARPTDQLYPELLRYADVVGATCIGAATARGLEATDFDLAIVDEAGQICLPDLLVPLVRAKRAVLVGDHHQLPPFVDSEVQNWLKNQAPQEPNVAEAIEEEEVQLISNLLTKSAFELLFTAKQDPLHIVRFTMQGRMPQVIANFVSRHFYSNQLGTFSAEKMRHTVDADPVFPHALTVIDVSDAPADIRWERPQKTLENLGEAGYTNIAEARIIAALAEYYQRKGKEWVVIVPYRAQARLIIRELEKRIEAQDFALEERVSTVDSFQGGERKKVIYGFTRSNEHGKIGFLKELRRLNVAMTRAQQHLLFVGNFAALTRAEDAQFRYVVTDVYSYATQCGEALTYESCRRRLRDAQGGRAGS
ncbi:MAG: AAA domain-containing protein [Chloroflexota bacterium]|nr:AAA domain-containing protein [Chloroflexota bacterium]